MSLIFIVDYLHQLNKQTISSTELFYSIVTSDFLIDLNIWSLLHYRKFVRVIFPHNLLVNCLFYNISLAPMCTNGYFHSRGSAVNEEWAAIYRIHVKLIITIYQHTGNYNSIWIQAVHRIRGVRNICGT